MSDMIIYKSEDGRSDISVRVENETVWLSLNQMAELFNRDKSTISRHIKNVSAKGELVRDSVVADYATTAADEKNRKSRFSTALFSVVKKVREIES